MEDKYDKYFDSKSIIISAYVPAAFCALISGMALFSSVTDGAWWKSAFFAFLPMCFMYYAFTMHAVVKQVRNLKNTVKDLNKERQSKKVDQGST